MRSIPLEKRIGFATEVGRSAGGGSKVDVKLGMLCQDSIGQEITRALAASR